MNIKWNEICRSERMWVEVPPDDYAVAVARMRAQSMNVEVAPVKKPLLLEPCPLHEGVHHPGLSGLRHDDCGMCKGTMLVPVAYSMDVLLMALKRLGFWTSIVTDPGGWTSAKVERDNEDGPDEAGAYGTEDPNEALLAAAHKVIIE